MKKPENIKEVMGWLGSQTSERKKAACRENWKKAVAGIKKKKLA